MLGLFAAAYSLYGGLSAVVWTDVIQVVFLVLGGAVTTYLALDVVSGGQGAIAGFSQLMVAAPDSFHMILDESNPEFLNLPGIWVLIGGLWVANIYYWGFNQYIIQRTLAAKSLEESQKGIALAAGLKLVIPFIVVIPGIAAYVMVNDPGIMVRLGEVAQMNLPSEGHSDKAYPWLLQLLPTGLKGVAFAALAAAVVSSLASMLNSAATIFTMDIYKQYINKNASEKQLVSTGRLAAGAALAIACIMAPLLGGIDQAFQFIQEYTGIVSPGILAVFILGLFWKKTTNKAAIWGTILSVPIAIALKFVPGIPFMNQMGLTALSTMALIAVIGQVSGGGEDDPKAIGLRKGLFKTTPAFNISAFAVCIITAVLYALFW